MRVVPFFRHDLGQPELDAVAEVLTGPILTTGDTVAEFESRFAELLGVEHVLGTTSCTGAIHMSLLALGVGAGDEVITTPMTFIASATAIMESGARPVFVDVEPGTGNLDVSRIEAAITVRTKAIVPVHLYGQMCDMRGLREIADRHGLVVVEDAAHCIEGERDRVRPGQLGETACFSFYATKNLTCGEGGAVATNDPALAEQLRLLRLHGMTKMAADREREGYTHWDMVLMGWKYNMDNIQAAFLLPQMQRLQSNWDHRKRVADRYRDALKGISGMELPPIVTESRHAHHLFPVCVLGGRRDEVIHQLQELGISTMVNYRAIHLLSYFQETLGHSVGDFPVAETIGDSTLSLPFYPSIPEEDVSAVIDALLSILDARPVPVRLPYAQASERDPGV